MHVTFFESYHEAAMMMADGDRLAFYDAVMAYAFEGVEPELDGMVKMAWLLVRPTIDANLSKQVAGSAGGRPSAAGSATKSTGKSTQKSTRKSTPKTTAEKQSEKQAEKHTEKQTKKQLGVGVGIGEGIGEGECGAHAPEISDVIAYSEANNLGIDSQAFFDYYSAQGWRLANGNPVLDWQAAARRWAAEDKRRRHDKPDAKLDERFARFDAIEPTVIAS